MSANLLTFLQYDFMQRALIAGIAVAVVAPVVGIFLVVRRFSLLADTLAHVSILGVAVGFLTQIYPLLTATVLTAFAAVGMERLRASRRLPGDAVLALFLSGSLAAAVVLFSVVHSFSINLLSFLFGSIATVTWGDLYLIVPFALLAVLFVVAFYKELFLVSFDEDLARANGLRAGALNLGLTVVAAVGIVLSIKIVGALLIGALMVIPATAAAQVRRSFRQTLGLAVALSLVAVVVGLVLSFYLGWASGGTIVLVSVVEFIACYILGRQ